MLSTQDELLLKAMVGSKERRIDALWHWAPIVFGTLFVLAFILALASFAGINEDCERRGGVLVRGAYTGLNCVQAK